MLCAINAFYCFLSLSKYVICPGNGEVLFAATVYFDTSEQSLLRAMNTLTYSYLVFLVLFFNATAVLESCLLFDMVATLKNPMKRPESRVKWYYLLTVVWQLITLIIFAAYDFDIYRWPVKASFYFTKTVYILMFFPGILTLIFHFRKGGLNQQYKKLYIRRYVLFILLMFICQLT